MKTLVIGGINVNNDYLLRDIQGVAGLAKSGEYRDQITKVIELGRYKTLIQEEVDIMVGMLVRHGFVVSYE